MPACTNLRSEADRRQISISLRTAGAQAGQGTERNSTLGTSLEIIEHFRPIRFANLPS